MGSDGSHLLLAIAEGDVESGVAFMYFIGVRVTVTKAYQRRFASPEMEPAWAWEGL